MTKVDAQRAIREARYEAYRKAQAATPATPRPAAAAPAPTQAAPAQPAAPEPDKPAALDLDALELADAEAAAAPALCGHKGGSGKPCTRPAGHPEKSHRYK